MIASLIVSAMSALPVVIASADELVPRAPILIEGNVGFNAANGVVSGSGTASNPYIIEHWDISAENANGIEIRNTTAYFIIRNCYVHDGKGNYNDGIYFENVRNGGIDGVKSENNWFGIYLSDSSGNAVENCTISNNFWQGIYLGNSSGNIIASSKIENNSIGVMSVINSKTNSIYHNNFVNNEIQAYDEGANRWDNGYLSGGNYWSDYSSADSFKGENQNILGSDGIGDVPYNIIGGSNRDRYPLMSPWQPGVVRGVSVSISPSSQSGANGGTLTYTVTVTNTGNVSNNYSLTPADTTGWSPRISPSSLTLAAGALNTATLTVIVPSGAAAGASTTITVTATSMADPSVNNSASCRATASAPSPGPGPTPTDTTPPPTPSLISPTNGANITDNTPALDWSDVSDPSDVTYDMSIARDAGFVSIALQKTGLTASTYELTPAEALAVGIYYWRARAVDGVGNIGSWSENWSFTVSIAPPTPLPPSVEIPLITPEAPARVEVENAAITALEISVLHAVENVRITVQELVDRPGEIAIAAPGAIYRYLEIIEENTTDNDIGSVTITFKVEKSWIEGENIDENTITLKRYNPENGGWVSLPTAKVSEDATHVYFSATSPGLSYFAVSGTAMTPAPATFTVSALTISPSQVSVGEEVSISVTVTNTGDLAGTYTVTLKINGIVENTENVTLAGGATMVVTFTISEDIEGTYNVEVGVQTGAFTVAKLQPTPMSWPLIVGVVGAIGISVSTAFYIRKMRLKRVKKRVKKRPLRRAVKRGKTHL
jgi:PGF-pre-PGF domain-containing protein